MRIAYWSSEFCSFFFFKQQTAYELRISDWSSDVCSSDLLLQRLIGLCSRRESTLYPLLCEALLVVAARRHELAVARSLLGPLSTLVGVLTREEIGRASCRASVCQYV